MNKRNAFVLMVLIIIALLMYAAYSITGKFVKPDSYVDLSHATVVKEIRSLNRLETAQFTFEKIIDAGVQGNFFQNILYGDRILLIAHADVIAGFDLAKIADNDIKVRNNVLTIQMPAPEILFSILDNTKTKVYDRRTGFLARSNKDLESEARAQAEASIRADACTAGILDDAAKNAKTQLELLYRTAGFAEVIIEIPEASCN